MRDIVLKKFFDSLLKEGNDIVAIRKYLQILPKSEGDFWKESGVPLIFTVVVWTSDNGRFVTGTTLGKADIIQMLSQCNVSPENLLPRMSKHQRGKFKGSTKWRGHDRYYSKVSEEHRLAFIKEVRPEIDNLHTLMEVGT